MSGPIHHFKDPRVIERPTLLSDLPILPKPHWERGYRCHGLWAGIVRIGVVGIGPRNLWKKSEGYRWRAYCLCLGVNCEGTAKNLRAAKLAVERAIIAGKPAHAPEPPRVPHAEG